MKKLILAVFIFALATPAFAWQQTEVSEQPYLYAFSSGTSVRTLKSGVGRLHTLTVTGGTASSIEIYDSITGGGTKMASFTPTNAMQSYLFDMSFSRGFTVVTAGTLQYTATYR